MCVLLSLNFLGFKAGSWRFVAITAVVLFVNCTISAWSLSSTCADTLVKHSGVFGPIRFHCFFLP